MSGETPKVFGSESENPDAEGLRQRTAIEVKHEEKSNPSMAEAPSTAEPASKKEMFGLERKNSSQKALLLIVFINSVSVFCINANIPFMCGADSGAGKHPDAFSSLPLDYNSAVYALTSAATVGKFFSSIFLVPLSDKYGRKALIVPIIVIQMILNVVAYFCRKSYWAFLVTLFVEGLFDAIATIGMAYSGDLYPNKPALRDAFVGKVMGISMLGMTAGGLLPLMFNSEGLFVPTLAAAGLLFLALVYVQTHMFPLEPSDAVQDKNVPEKELDKKLLFNIIFGAFVDNCGSAGLNLCLNPIMLTTFTCCLSMDGFLGIAVTAIMPVLVGVIISGKVFKKFGVAMGCVLGNIFTGILIIILFLLAKPTMDDALASGSEARLYVFIVMYYIGVPFTVLSQLTTGPMLLAIAPPSKRGTVQGYNTGVMTLGIGLANPVLAYIGDSAGNETMIWTCVGLSVFAAVVNFPLTRNPLFRPKTQVADAKEEFTDLKVNGWMPLKDLVALNMGLTAQGKEPQRIPFGTYAADKERLELIRKQGNDDLHSVKEVWGALLDPSDEELESHQRVINKRMEQDKASPQVPIAFKEFGQWFADYMQDSGYPVTGTPSMWKTLLMNAFPPLPYGPDRKMENFDKAHWNNFIYSYIQHNERFMEMENDSFGGDDNYETLMAANPYSLNRLKTL